MDFYLGSLLIFGGNFAIRDFGFCNGTLISISSNSALYAVIGTIYGGNGRTTFALPELRGRAPLHFGTGPGLSFRPQGQMYGFETITLTKSEMPVHNHTAQTENNPVTNAPVTGSVEITQYVNSGNGTEDSPVGHYLAKVPAAGKTAITPYATTTNRTQMGAQSGDITGGTTSFTVPPGTVDVGNTGGGQPHFNMQPFTVLNYLICLSGIFPPRN